MRQMTAEQEQVYFEMLLAIKKWREKKYVHSDDLQEPTTHYALPVQASQSDRDRWQPSIDRTSNGDTGLATVLDKHQLVEQLTSYSNSAD